MFPSMSNVAGWLKVLKSGAICSPLVLTLQPVEPGAWGEGAMYYCDMEQTL